MAKTILAIDQGTTGSTALVVSAEGKTLGKCTVEFPQHFPKPGWVEHDTFAIWSSVEGAVRGALKAANVDASTLAAIGITNQRETTVVWDRKTGLPIHNAIVWQCRRTASICEELKAKGHEANVRKKTGLVIDAYFSATKVAWILDNVENARKRADSGELAFGTIDSFLVHKLTDGGAHVIDVTNASRTSLMDLASASWDTELCAIFRVPASVLPSIVGSAEVVARTRSVGFLPDGIPIAGIAGDQQAALFGQACFREGEAKSTYGTGAFVLMNIGPKPVESERGLVTTVAWRVGDTTTYALEGSAFIAGAAVQWLRDGLGLIEKAADIEALAAQVPSTEGVSFVPALSGLGAPHWQPHARGTITGITRGTTKAHLARATLEGIAFQVNDLVTAMVADSKRSLTRLKVDGGAAANGLLMQFQADISGVSVVRPKEIESTGRGAAMLAAVGVGLIPWTGRGAPPDALEKLVEEDKTFAPVMTSDERSVRQRAWDKAVLAAKVI